MRHEQCHIFPVTLGIIMAGFRMTGFPWLTLLIVLPLVGVIAGVHGQGRRCSSHGPRRDSGRSLDRTPSLVALRCLVRPHAVPGIGTLDSIAVHQLPARPRRNQPPAGPHDDGSDAALRPHLLALHRDAGSEFHGHAADHGKRHDRSVLGAWILCCSMYFGRRC